MCRRKRWWRTPSTSLRQMHRSARLQDKLHTAWRETGGKHPWKPPDSWLLPQTPELTGASFLHTLLCFPSIFQGACVIIRPKRKLADNCRNGGGGRKGPSVLQVGKDSMKAAPVTSILSGCTPHSQAVTSQGTPRGEQQGLCGPWSL